MAMWAAAEAPVRQLSEGGNANSNPLRPISKEATGSVATDAEIVFSSKQENVE
jgi:hypothetical protein